MTQVSLEMFKGLETQGDSYSVEGSPDCENIEIDIYNDINKSKGYTALSSTNKTTITLLKDSSTLVLGINNHGLSVNDIVVLYNVTGALSVYNNMAFRVKTKTDNNIVILDVTVGAGTVLDATGSASYILKSVVHTVTPIAPTGGIALSSITCLGYTEFNGEIVRMISNGTNGYLVKTTGINASDLTIVENVLLFDATNPVNFKQFDDPRSDAKYLLFVNGVKKQIGTYGGVFYWAGTAGGNVVALFGVANNPTGKYIEVHDSRIWVGYITAQVNTDITNGKHWIAVSKLFPEAVDTSFTISAMTISPAAGGRTYITATGHTFKVGDTIYIDGVAGTAGTSVLNGAYHDISEVESNKFYIDTDTTGFLYTSGGTATLRGNTWSQATAIYEDVVVGAGIMRPDNEPSDPIVALRSAFGVLTIYRQKSVYFFTGSIESGTASLARKMNIPFGCVSPSTELTDGGVWFCGAHGLYKTEGITIDTVKTELDTIQASPFTEVIKPTYDGISNKANIILFLNGNTLYMHDKDNNITYTLNLINSQWSKLTNRYFDGFVRVNNVAYGVKGIFTLTLDSGYQTYNPTTLTYTNIASYYKTNIFNLGTSSQMKQLFDLIALLKTTTTSAQTAELTFNFYYDGSSVTGGSVAFNIKTTTGGTWNSITSNSTLTWNQVTSNGTLTWGQIVGAQENMVQRRARDLGTFTELQIGISHMGNEAFKVSRFALEYDLLTD